MEGLLRCARGGGELYMLDLKLVHSPVDYKYMCHIDAGMPGIFTYLPLFFYSHNGQQIINPFSGIYGSKENLDIRVSRTSFLLYIQKQL